MMQSVYNNFIENWLRRLAFICGFHFLMILQILIEYLFLNVIEYSMIIIDNVC